jgi:hypothetical protein
LRVRDLAKLFGERLGKPNEQRIDAQARKPPSPKFFSRQLARASRIDDRAILRPRA